MKFGQLIECNMRNIFLEKTCGGENAVEKLFPDPFLKNKIDHISGLTVQPFMQFVFIVLQVEGYQHILKLSSK